MSDFENITSGIVIQWLITTTMFSFMQIWPMRIIFTFISMLLLLGCRHDTAFQPQYNVPEDLQPIVDSFIAEAKARGYSGEITNLIIEYDAALPSPYCAQCNSNALNVEVQKIITINPDLQCWFSEEEKEAFIFHELGHCVLGRLHDSSLLPNGDPKSIMIADYVGMYAPCLYPIDDQPCNNLFKRPYYIDELFDESTEVPEWGK